ncbi:hypothetical protein Pmar_PMAR024889 [Perkinsus marinus ATCC 50983]|uniref:Uncharacterized protein n=1 Tax=Perkinsus marinus (strain ATCC 50983 / TXsc) TaxID=423536 RepID=C5LCX3_PERM5|nr:hypothetical protein Pmar_PMAR024889 [Perkinsus marinus ATCC 50983]EER05426.1 hypothetical protein Pmar_PMAR024889 [Perkinsus marinus ATCC 50983]|eukprot:XP_002773610.1 hypothetical protein Pmar_PMAR024889 [Perkinsus marinus ATCC 50983]
MNKTTSTLKSCLRDKTKGSCSTCSLGSDASTITDCSDTTASSDAENTAPKRRCLSVTFPDQQSTSSACFTRSHSCVETAKVSNGIHDCLPTVTLDVPPYRNVEEPSIQSLATYHYVESYKDYNRRNSTWHPSVSAGLSSTEGCMGAILACLSVLPSQRRYRLLTR